MKKSIKFFYVLACFLLTFSACKKDNVLKDNDNNVETPTVIPGTFTPEHDGVFIKIDEEILELQQLILDVQTIPTQLRFWIYSSGNDYPQYSGWMDNKTGTCANAALQYMESENNLDANGFPLWQGTELSTTLVSIDYSNHKFCASQTGILKNSATDEQKTFCIVFQNATWQPAPEANKKIKAF
ncbi:MAG: hypothetical protein MJZ72_03625 [Bacteroidales bacterium]|nr:hypothetical protein [Bacteroidales bacterium]